MKKLFKINIWLTIISLSFVLTLSSCSSDSSDSSDSSNSSNSSNAPSSSNELSRSQAKKILEKTIADKNKMAKIKSGAVVENSDDYYTDSIYTKRVTLEIYRSMEKQGLVNLQDLGKEAYYNDPQYLVTFPDEVKNKYIKSTEVSPSPAKVVKYNGKTYTKELSVVDLGKYSLKEITGIRQEGEEMGAKARVEFIMQLEKTPFGQFMLDDFMQGDIQAVAIFEKWDDGWRIAKENGIYLVEAEKRKMLR